MYQVIRQGRSAGWILGVGLVFAGAHGAVAQTDNSDAKLAEQKEQLRRYESLKDKYRESSAEALAKVRDRVESINAFDAKRAETLARFSATRDPLGLVLVPASEPLRAQLNLKDKGGVVVTEVNNNSIGATLGFHVNDLILKVDANPIATSDDLKQVLTDAVEKPKTVVLLRQGEKLEIVVSDETAKKVARLYGLPVKEEAATQQGYWIGIGLGEVEESLCAQLKIKKDEAVLATQVVENSPAAKAGVKTNDVLLALGSKLLSSPSVLIQAVQESNGEPMTLRLMRGGQLLRLEIKPEKRPVNVAVKATGTEPARQLLEALAVRPGVVVSEGEVIRYLQDSTQPKNVDTNGLKLLAPPFPVRVPYRGELNVNDANVKSLDEKLNKLSKQIDELQRAVKELSADRKGSSKR